MEPINYNSPGYWKLRFENNSFQYESGGLKGYLLPQGIYEEFINSLSAKLETDEDFINRLHKMNEMGFTGLKVFISVGVDFQEGDAENFWSEEIHLKSDKPFTVQQLIPLVNWFHSADEFEITEDSLIVGYAN